MKRNVDLPSTIRSIDGLAKQEEYTTNLFKSEKMLLPRFGVTATSLDFDGAVRGIFRFNGSTYIVAGTDLYKYIDSTTVPTSLGTISGSGLIQAEGDFTEAVILAPDADVGYILDTSDTLTSISSPNFSAASEVALINRRAIYVPKNGDPPFFSDVSDFGTIQAASFFDAEELPDLNNGVFVSRNEAFIMGADSIERFRPIGPSNAPYTRVDGGTVNVGYMGGKVRWGETFLFVGRERDQGAGIFLMGQGYAERISNQAIDTILAGYTPSELAGIHAQRVRFKGHDLMFFHLPNETLMYHQGWHYAKSPSLGYLDARFATLTGNIYLVGDSDGKIGIVSEVDADFGASNSYEIYSYARAENEDSFSVNSIGFSVGNSFNTNTMPVGLSVSRDGATFGPVEYRDPNISNQIIFNPPGGLGWYEGFMAYKLQTTGAAQFSIDSAVIDIDDQ